jgi:predicted nucleotidyltransferase
MLQTDAVSHLVRAVLGSAVLGVYLHGSAVLGGLRPTSDVDVLVVVRRRTTAAERRAIVDHLLDISGARARRGSARPVELTIVVQSDVRPWRYPPRREFQYGEWRRDSYEQGVVPSPQPDPDLAILITMVLAGNHALFGPPPAALLDPVPSADLRRAMIDGVPGLLADLDTDTRNVILTLARIWVTLATGEILPKNAAADWALARLPEESRPVLARARDLYLAGEEDRWDDIHGRVQVCADHVVGEIERECAYGT